MVLPSSLRALAWITVFCGTIGTCGVGSSIVSVRALNAPGVSTAPRGFGSSNPDVSEAVLNSTQTLVATLQRTPLRHALLVANILLSAMLVMGSVLLVNRRRSAPWWVTQACVANLLWTAADSATHIRQLNRHKAELARVLDAEITARVAAKRFPKAAPTEPALRGSDVVVVYIVLFAGYGVLRALVYAWLVYRVRKPDIRVLLDSTPGRFPVD